MKLASPGRVLANTFVVAFVAWFTVAGVTSTTDPAKTLTRAVELISGNPLISVPVILAAVAFVLFGNSGGSTGVRLRFGAR